ncbi:hypothetical protein [Mycolicibacterium palauense]|uniref:hypothetical protein n=1 Tax=Mycolicibacterium palauense TaxID=2034511 RepID=UPI000BFEFB97|nr:hypothetical protein [Mycolicibacterium palauense]
MSNFYQRVIPTLAAGVAAAGVGAAAVLAAPVAAAAPQPGAPTLTAPTSLTAVAAPAPTSSMYCDLGFYCEDDEIGSMVDPSAPSTNRPGFGKASPWVPDYGD